MLSFPTRSLHHIFFLLSLFLGAYANAVLAQTLRFQDVTNNAHVAAPNDPEGFGHGVAAADFNNDGLPDIYVVSYTAANALFLNNGDGTFTEVALSADVANTTALQDRGVAAADYDNDGNVDIYVATAANANKILYRNNGNGTFSDVTFSAGLSDYGLQGQGVAWGDYDNDGNLDLFICTYDNAFKLYRQSGDHTFDEVTYAAGLDGSQGSVQAVFFDCDSDGDLDLFVGRGAGLPNRLFINRGNGTFDEESANRNLADPAPHAQGITVGDYDNDGDLDLYMCSDQSVNRLYRNDEGVFSEVAAQAGVADNSRSLGCHFADFNNDGWLDLYVINFGTNRLYRNNGNGTFTDQTSSSGADNSDRGYGSVVTDYDGDGLLDVYFSNSGQNSNLLRNTTSSSNNWLKFALRGVNSNRNGIGARVLVTSGGLQQTQQLLSGFAMVSGGSDLTLHFGLGSNNVAERVEVIWPSGERDVLTGVTANQSLTIQEGSYGNIPTNDTDPPIISIITASNITGSNATITWNTNEAADSQIEYGLTAGYGATTALDAARVLNHSVNLIGLDQNTTYHYRIHSRDAAGNLATSDDFTFTTTAQTVLLADDFNGASLDLNKWTRGGNSGNQSAVAGGALNLQSSGTESGWIFTKAAYPGANKIVQIKITQPNDDGDLGMSPTVSTNNANAFYGQSNWYRFYVYRNNHAGNYLLFAQWNRSGAVNGLDVTNGLNLSNSFWLRLRTDANNIYFEYSANNANWVTVYQEVFNLPGYTLANSFYYELSASRTSTNGTLQADDFSLSESVPNNDTQAPLITNAASGALTSSSAFITWNTDEASDSQVEYGTTTSYGTSSPLDPALVISHGVPLSGLSENTTYHYRVHSRDASGNLARSNDFTFTTPANSGTVTIFADNFNNASLNTNAWQRGTNGGNQTVVANNALELRSNSTQTAWVVTRQSYSARNTTVAVRVVQPNDDGNLGMSPTYQAGSSNGIYSESNWYRFYAYRDAPGNYRLYVQWKKNGVVNGLDVTGNMTITAQTGVYSRLRFDDTRIHFEASLDGVNWTNTYNEPFALPGYTLSSNFFYELAAARTPSNGVMILDDFAITTPGGQPDTQPPVISSVAATPTANAATITWNTGELSDSQVEYGLTANYGNATVLETSLVNSHSAVIAGLNANTTYHYRVHSKDAAGNLATSGDFTFTTQNASILSFTDITQSAGTGGPTDPNLLGGHAAIFSDVNNDGRPDLYITMLGASLLPMPDLFFRNNGNNVFIEEAALRGIDDFDGGSHGACFGDLDNDGDYDLYNGTTDSSASMSAINNIFRNEGNGFFTDVTAASGIPSRSWQTRAVLAFDMDGDGDLDLFGVTDYLGTDDPPGDRNEVYRNDGGLKFTAINSGALFVARVGQGATDTDFDNDGDIDIFAANRTGEVNILRNDGNGTFTQITPASLGITHRADDGITSADIDNDGDMDLLLTRDDSGSLYRNLGNGTFAFVREFTATDGYMGGFADLDNDGDLDLVFAGDDVSYLNNGAGNFTTGPSISVTGINDPRAIGFADIDNDGDLDFAFGCKRSRNWLVRNNNASNNWLKIKLVSPQGQAGAYGAKTRIYPAGQAGATLLGLRESRSNNGYLGQDDQVVHFGLGNRAAVDVVVEFLDGTSVTAANVSANQTITINGVSADVIAPVVSQVAVKDIFETGATIAWQTNEISTAQVEYGPTPALGLTTNLETTLRTSHSLALANLTSHTLYYYRAVSQDHAGNRTASEVLSFTTLGSDPVPPVISNVTAANVTSTSAEITFSTDRNAFGIAEFDTLTHDSTRVMPLGNSITEGTGSSDDAGYRSGLYALLTNFGSRFDFVGSMQYGINLPDPDHEGHAGHRADEILPELNGYLQQSQPEAVLLHVGTNDVSIGDHYGTVVNEISAIVDAILQFNANTKIYLSTLIPRLDNKQSVNDAVNANLPDVVNDRASAGYKIFLVDNSAAFLANPNWAAQWMDDNVHPNDAGYAVMAQQWHQAYINTEYENAVSNNTLATAHNLTLTNLTPGATYHYRARAKDQAGLESASADFTFTTSPVVPATVALHGIHEITLRAQQLTPSPYTQGPSVNVTFNGTSGDALGKTITLPGFWAGNDLYRVRFTPTHTGDWSWQSSSSDAGLNNQGGILTCVGTLTAPHISARGHVREALAYPYTFAHADSTPFFIMGDTQWSFATEAITWPEEFQTYVDTRAAQGFNYVHGLVYNTYPAGNQSNGGGPIFHGGNVDSLNPGFFQAFDQRVAYMNEKGLAAGLMLAWGDGAWQNFSTATQVERFVQYVVARYAAYNVFWITAGEYEEGAPPGGHGFVGTLVKSLDPYHHPVTIHTVNSSADEFSNAAWKTTIYQQTGNPALITRDRIYNRPVINSEFGYEGDQSAEALRQDAWQIVMRGGFTVYGDTNTYHYNAKMTPQYLNSPGAQFMIILKNFWTNNTLHQPQWWRFTRFDTVGAKRFLAGLPGIEYVVYADTTGAFQINLAEANGTINGQWFDTRSGNWGATFSGNTSAAFALTPPASGYAAYLSFSPTVPPPVISQVQTSSVTSTAALVTWQTDKLADAQVEYGLNTSYGTFSVLDTAKVINHKIALSGLIPSTLYHFRVRSRDAQGVPAVSDDFTFTTSPSSMLLSDNFDGTTLDLNKWVRGANSGNQTTVVNNTLELRSTGTQSGWVITKQAFVPRNTSFTVKVMQPNDDGNLGLSPTYNASASNGIYSEANWYRFYVYREEPGNYRLYVQWRKSGAVGGLDVTGSTNITAQSGVHLRMRMDDTDIYFEALLPAGQWIEQYREPFGLPGYTLSNQFYYELAASRTATNGVLIVDEVALQSTASSTDTQPPQISNITVSNISTQSATIFWNTDEPGDAQVEYGLTSSYGSFSALDAAMTNAHSVALNGLLPDTTYHFRVHSRDAAGNASVSADNSFRTLSSGNVAFANVRDLFNRNCVRCHQGNTAPANLVLAEGQALQNIVAVASTQYPQWLRVNPGNRTISWLYEKIVNPNPAVGSKMENLSPEEIELIGRWIDQGAREIPLPPYADLQFRTMTMLPSEINVTYGVEIIAWGGLPPYQFEVSAGALPSGLVLDGASGQILGMPATPGQYDFTIRVSDDQTPAASREQAYSITVNDTQAHWQVPQGFEISAVVSDLHLPVNIAFVPNPGATPNDPYFYVTLLYGDIITVQRDFQKFTYATNLLNFNPTGEFPGSGELGVTGIAVDPNSGDVFATMVYDSLGLKYGKVVRFQSNDGGRTAASQTTLLSGILSSVSHQIQAVTMGPDEKLYVNVGDGFYSDSAADLNDLRGKILRMNLDGSIPSDNPFPNSFVYAYGLRNPFGAAWRETDDRLYISDNGPSSNDRLVKIQPGANHGWPTDLTQGAIHLWNPTVAPVGMDFLTDASFPSSYHGQLFVGWSGPTYQTGTTSRGKKIQAFALNADGTVASNSIFLDYVGAGRATVIGVACGPDGLYFTDLYGENGFDQFGQTHGNIYRIKWNDSDLTAPLITNVTIDSVTASRALVRWTTNEPATSVVDFGTSTAYGFTVSDPAVKTQHNVWLNGLSASTLYHFRVRSNDASNNEAVGSDATFTTLTGGGSTTLFADNFNTASLDLNKWSLGANNGNRSAASNNALQLESVGSQSGWVATKQALVASNTAVTVKIVQPNNDGALGMSPTYNLSSTSGFYGGNNWYRFYVYRDQFSGPYLLYVQWSKGGAVNGLDVTGNLVITSAVYLRMRFDTARIYFEASLDSLNWNVAYQEPFALPGYSLNDGFYYELAAYRTSNNGVLRVDDFAITGPGSSAAALAKTSSDETTAAAIPQSFALSQNYPNPFNVETRVRLDLPENGWVRAVIFNLNGQEVKRLHDETFSAGAHVLQWNGTNELGEVVSSGVYLLRLSFEGDDGTREVATKRLMLMK